MMVLCNRIVRLLVASVLAAVLIGCSQQKSSSTQAARIPATPFSVVATGDSNFDASQARTFSWSTDMQELSGVPRLQDVPFREMLEESITANMNAKGYHYLGEQGTGDLVVGYSLSMDDAEMNSDAARRVGIIPSLNFSTPDPEKFEKGTIVIEVTQSATRMIAWRSALQGFSIIDLDDADRRKRLDGMVQRMLSGLPARTN
jgi:hypothetical protein